MFGKRSKRQQFNDSFYRAVAPALLVSQCFGLMPVIGVIKPNHTYITFRWLNIRTILACVNIVWGYFFAVIALYAILLEGITVRNIVGVVFFVCCSTAMVLFVRLAKNWNIIMRTWYTYEESFLNQKIYPQDQLSLSAKLLIATIIVIFMALLEHSLYIISRWYDIYFITKMCNIAVTDWWKYYFEHHLNFIWIVLPYHALTSFFLEYINFSLTISWNYLDLFIMLISIGISTRFNQMNHRLKKTSNQILPHKLWQQIRSDYVQLCELVEYMNDHLASIILLSCTNNLYFICFQLLNIFNSLPHTINKVYFWFSLLYLIGRTILVYLCAASIHDSSKLPVEVLRTIPSIGWCSELDRFMEQVRSETIALSGSNFFYMTRKLLFGIAATIVTYELVLIQVDEGELNSNSGNSTNHSICDVKFY